MCLKLHSPLQARQFNLQQQQICAGDLYIFHLSSYFLPFSAPLGYILSNSGISTKIINKPSTSTSKNHHFVWKRMIRHKKSSFAINICSYLIGIFQYILENILTHNFCVYKLVWNVSLYAHWRWFWVLFESILGYLHITVTVGGPLQSK